MKKKVCIVQPYLHHYRVPFYRMLRETLLRHQVECVLIHGQPDPEQSKRNDEGRLDWALRIRNRQLRLGGVEMLWQPCLRQLRGADLVIIQQENRLLLNYLLMLRRRLAGPNAVPRIGLWGHGVNCQSNRPSSLRERWKRSLIRQADWWFAYTDFTRDILIQERFQPERITVVQNAIDTSELRTNLRTIPEDEVLDYRGRLGILGSRVGVYCGALYRRKRIDFLIAAARLIRTCIPDFELVVIGAGQDAPLLSEAAADCPWIHPLGPRFGRDKALALRLGQVFLMPKLVGLAILDAFSVGQPLFTTRNGHHGPEISYLRPGENGCLTADSPEAYSSEVVEVLRDAERLSRLRENCLNDASRYTIEAMADNFAQGVLACLDIP